MDFSQVPDPELIQALHDVNLELQLNKGDKDLLILERDLRDEFIKRVS